MRNNIENSGGIPIRIHQKNYDVPSTMPVFDSLRKHGYPVKTGDAVKLVDPVLKTHVNRLSVNGDETSLEICRQVLEGNEMSNLRNSLREHNMSDEDYRGLAEMIVAGHLESLLDH